MYTKFANFSALYFPHFTTFRWWVAGGAGGVQGWGGGGWWSAGGGGGWWGAGGGGCGVHGVTHLTKTNKTQIRAGRTPPFPTRLC